MRSHVTSGQIKNGHAQKAKAPHLTKEGGTHLPRDGAVLWLRLERKLKSVINDLASCNSRSHVGRVRVAKDRESFHQAGDIAARVIQFPRVSNSYLYVNVTFEPGLSLACSLMLPLSS